MATSVPHLVIPGSSLRGPLRHRMLFHACRRAGYSLDRADPTALGLAEQWVRALFGSDPAERDLILGRLSLSEVYLPLTFAAEEPPAALPEPMVQHHMGGDRFTGGVLGSALFNEKPLYQDAFTLTIQDQGDPTNAAAPEALACLELTLDDLRYGRLPLGSGAGRGNGRFLGPDRPDPSPRSTPSTPPSPVS